MPRLTAAEDRLLSYLQQYYQQHQKLPLKTHIAQGMGYGNRSSIYRAFNGLVAKHYIEVSQQSYTLIERPPQYLQIMGKIAAGKPLEAIEIPESFPIMTPENTGTYFLLEIQGDSMQDIGIIEGDLVMIKQQHYANDGDIVVALVESQATLKAYHPRKDGKVELKAYNDKYPTMIYASDQVTIQGVYCGARFDKAWYLKQVKR